jgi:hypothetical protein
LRPAGGLGLATDGITFPLNYPEAWAWFKRAETQGLKLPALEARRVGKRLTPEQQEQASRVLEAALRQAAESRNRTRGILDPLFVPSAPSK